MQLQAVSEYNLTNIEPEVLGHLNGVKTAAFPDTGAECNFMSLRYARKQGFILAKGEHRTFKLANGKVARALGRVETKWKFFAEPGRTYDLVFYVLPKCSRHVILGNTFLQETKTMSIHKQRIRYAKRRITQRAVNLIGNHNMSQRMAGSLNGVPVLALPDSGAQPNIVSAAFVEANGWEISDNRSSLRFADGSVQDSLGQVCGTWRFGENDGRETRQLVFEVLRDCPFDVVLGQEVVYGIGIYQNYADALITVIGLSKYGHGFNLVVYVPRFLKKFRRKLSNGEASCQKPRRNY